MSKESPSCNLVEPKKELQSVVERNFELAKRELLRSFGWNIASVESPESAPPVIDFAKFWRESGLVDGFRGKKIVFPRDNEIFVGINYKPNKKEIGVTELAVGEQFEVTYDGLHFVEIHNEPDDPGIVNDIGELYDNLPDLYFGDMQDFLSHDEVYCSIIVRMIDEKNAGIALALKTDRFEPKQLPLRAITDLYSRFLTRVQRTLEKDDVLAVKNGVAVYRGFVELPPKNGRNYLRLRKPD